MTDETALRGGGGWRRRRRLDLRPFHPIGLCGIMVAPLTRNDTAREERLGPMHRDPDSNQQLIRAYLAGEITPALWDEHLAAVPGLREQWTAMTWPMAPAPGTADHDAARLRAQSPVYRREARRALLREVVQLSLMLIGAGAVVGGALWVTGVLHRIGAL